MKNIQREGKKWKNTHTHTQRKIKELILDKCGIIIVTH